MIDPLSLNTSEEETKRFFKIIIDHKHTGQDCSEILENIFTTISHPPTASNETMSIFHERARIASLIIKNRAATQNEAIVLSKISTAIGEVPELNNFETPSLKGPSWESARKETVKHSTEDARSLVASNQPYAQDKSIKNYHASLTTLTFHSTTTNASDLHGDHLQSEHDIKRRQNEVLHAINTDILFAQECQKNPNFSRWFTKESSSSSQWEKTSKFDQDYQNNTLNLSLMTSGENTTKGKQDPIEYLNNNTIYQKFTADPSIAPISKKSILYTTNNNKLLAEALKEWSINNYPITRKINLESTITSDIVRDISIKIDQNTNIQEKREAHFQLTASEALRNAGTHHLQEKTIPDPSKSPISDSDEIDYDLLGKIVAKAHHKVLENIELQYKQERKKQKTDDSQTDNSQTVKTEVTNSHIPAKI